MPAPLIHVRRARLALDTSKTADQPAVAAFPLAGLTGAPFDLDLGFFNGSQLADVSAVANVTAEVVNADDIRGTRLFVANSAITTADLLSSAWTNGTGQHCTIHFTAAQTRSLIAAGKVSSGKVVNAVVLISATSSAPGSAPDPLGWAKISFTDPGTPVAGGGVAPPSDPYLRRGDADALYVDEAELAAYVAAHAGNSAPRILTGAATLAERTLAVGETVVLADGAGSGGAGGALILPAGTWGSLIRIVSADASQLDCYLDITTSVVTVSADDDADVTVGAVVAGVQHVVAAGREITLVHSEDEWRAGTPGSAASLATTMGCVVHGAVAGLARPAGFAAVTWIGSVSPTNATNNDIWEQTA